MLTAVIIASVYISYFGIETDKFDHLIKEKANKVNNYTVLKFRKTKIYFNPSELGLVVKLQNHKVLVKNNEFSLSKLYLF